MLCYVFLAPPSTKVNQTHPMHAEVIFRKQVNCTFLRVRSHDKFLIFLDANLETRFSRRETLPSKVSRIENRVPSLEDRDASDCRLTSERYTTATKVKTLLKKLFRVNFSNHFSISLAKCSRIFLKLNYYDHIKV